MKNNNMNIWDSLSKTNPDHTKQAPSSYGEKITTIDAMQQIKNMTEYFGPVGQGWSYQVKYNYTDKLVFAEVSIQYCLDNKWYAYGPVCSVAPLGNKRGLDDEAPKKAMTDAMTKAFSHLGLNADVFLGMFDNNKYVESLRKQFSKPSSVVAFPQKKNSSEKSVEEPTYIDDDVDVEKIIQELSKTKTEKQFDAVKDKFREQVDYLKEKNPNAYNEIGKFAYEHEGKLNNNQQQS